MFDALNEIADVVHELSKSKGWHDPPVPTPVLIANLHGEVSELWEAYRRGELNKPCDKSSVMTCAEEELADIIIRALDSAKVLGVDIGQAVSRKHEYNSKRPYRHGGKIA